MQNHQKYTCQLERRIEGIRINSPGIWTAKLGYIILWSEDREGGGKEERHGWISYEEIRHVRQTDRHAPKQMQIHR